MKKIYIIGGSNSLSWSSYSRKLNLRDYKTINICIGGVNSLMSLVQESQFKAIQKSDIIILEYFINDTREYFKSKHSLESIQETLKAFLNKANKYNRKVLIVFIHDYVVKTTKPNPVLKLYKSLINQYSASYIDTWDLFTNEYANYFSVKKWYLEKKDRINHENLRSTPYILEIYDRFTKEPDFDSNVNDKSHSNKYFHYFNMRDWYFKKKTGIDNVHLNSMAHEILASKIEEMIKEDCISVPNKRISSKFDDYKVYPIKFFLKRRNRLKNKLVDEKYIAINKNEEFRLSTKHKLLAIKYIADKNSRFIQITNGKTSTVLETFKMYGKDKPMISVVTFDKLFSDNLAEEYKIQTIQSKNDANLTLKTKTGNQEPFTDIDFKPISVLISGKIHSMKITKLKGQ